MSCGQVESTAIPDCYDPSVYNDTTTITADPDIAGVGVISAFIVATALALLLSFLHVLIDSDRVPQINKHVRNKEKWLGLLEALILTLSDQQLATGLAILIAGFVRWNEITIYHWEIITDLAFMSSNTHLSTLAVLRHTFRQHGQWGVRLWRIIAMLVFAILLFVANIYTGYGYWEDSPAWPMRCVALELKRDLRGNYRGSQARSAEVWSAFLISNYAVAILGLFENVSKWTRDLLQRKRDKVNRAYQKLEADREKGSSLRQHMSRLRLRVCMFGLFLISCIHSNWFFILEDSFWFLYNLIPLIQWRQYYRCDLDEPGKENDVTGFGQILPLVLLLLPLMQFTELRSSF